MINQPDQTRSGFFYDSIFCFRWKEKFR